MTHDGFPLPVLAAQDSCGAGCCGGRCHDARPWRSLEEKRGQATGSPDEFPQGASAPPEGVARRTFLQLAGASLALAGLDACFRPPPEKILPYGKQQAPELVPGNPLHFATATSLGGYAHGWVVTSREGRPIKVEGNPLHPENVGATTPLEQAELLQLYDRSRPHVLTHRGALKTKQQYLQEMSAHAQTLAADGGARLRFLLEPSASPLHGALRAEIQRRYPRARIQSYAALPRDNASEGARLAFGRPVETVHALDGAKVVVSLDEDFLSGLPGNLRRTRDFTRHRDATEDLNRLYVVESQLSVTGGFADHRLRVKPSQVLPFARALAPASARAAGALRPAPGSRRPRGPPQVGARRREGSPR